MVRALSIRVEAQLIVIILSSVKSDIKSERA